ncbi:hypothetical protein AKJ09_05529 [Labilithrix luteola]|uniref:Uncharacterized protein n=1 Tax=Labilithrix luteola TaxID=1391654 RepID=A0A0K1PZA1_9BACT|nr:hypothetical protein AKJ09_05529 [Labilithrix luteola]
MMKPSRHSRRDVRNVGSGRFRTTLSDRRHLVTTQGIERNFL